MAEEYLLPILVFSTIFERFNVFLEPFDFSLKLSLILLPVVGLILLIKKKLTFNPTLLFPFLAAVLAVEVLSTFFSYDRIQSFQVVVFHLLMVGLFYLFVWAVPAGNHHPRSPVRPPEADSGPPRRWPDGLLRGGAYGWIVGAFVASLYGIWQFVRFAGGQSPAIFLDELLGAKSLPATTFVHQAFGQTLLRPSSTFIDVNTAASFVGIAILLALGSNLLISLEEKRSKKGWTLLAILLLFFVMTLSRSALFGFGIGLTAFVVLNLWGWVRRAIVIGVASVLLLLVGVGIGYLSFAKAERWQSSLARIEYARAATAMLRENPLLGVGVGNFEPYYTRVLRPNQAYGYSHSIFLTWLGETGILGLLANLALIGVAIWALVRETLRHRLGSLWRLRLSALLSAFIALVTANIFHAHYGLEFTWVLLGLAVSGYYLAKRDNEFESRLAGRGLHYLAKNGKWKMENGKLSILGVRVDNVTMRGAVGRVKELFKAKRQAYLVTPNPEMVMEARRDFDFAKVLNEADLAIPDGVGLVWASRILGTPLKERVSGTDLFLELCKNLASGENLLLRSAQNAEAARRGGRVFLLGGEEGIAEKAARELKERYPRLRIVGTFAGDGSKRGDRETVAVIRKAGNQVIRKKKHPVTQLPSYPIDLLFVAYGHGKQERWIKRNLEKLPVKVAMGVGGAFDFVAGKVPRAPRFIRRLGLEWLFRLLQEPHRFRRQLALTPFTVLVFKEALRSL